MKSFQNALKTSEKGPFPHFPRFYGCPASLSTKFCSHGEERSPARDSTLHKHMLCTDCASVGKRRRKPNNHGTKTLVDFVHSRLWSCSILPRWSLSLSLQVPSDSWPPCSGVLAASRRLHDRGRLKLSCTGNRSNISGDHPRGPR